MVTDDLHLRALVIEVAYAFAPGASSSWFDRFTEI
jgi:hypothetical protein